MTVDSAVTDPPDWMADGSCVTAGDPDAWHPAGQAPDPLVLRICAGCPVADLCLEYAVANPDLVGVWAGTTARQRGAMRTAAGVARRPPAPRMPHGTTAAARRHWRHKEPLCAACHDAVRRESKDRYARARQDGAA